MACWSIRIAVAVMCGVCIFVVSSIALGVSMSYSLNAAEHYALDYVSATAENGRQQFIHILGRSYDKTAAFMYAVEQGRFDHVINQSTSARVAIFDFWTRWFYAGLEEERRELMYYIMGFEDQTYVHGNILAQDEFLLRIRDASNRTASSGFVKKAQYDRYYNATTGANTLTEWTDTIYNPLTRPWYTAVNKTYGRLAYSQRFLTIYDVPVIAISGSLFSASAVSGGVFVGVVSLMFRLDDLSRHLLDLPRTPNAIVVVIDNDGFLLASTHESSVPGFLWINRTLTPDHPALLAAAARSNRSESSGCETGILRPGMTYCATNLDAYDIRALGELEAMRPDLVATGSPDPIHIKLPSGDAYAAVRRIDVGRAVNMAWRVVTIIPATDILGKITDGRNYAILFVAVVVVASVVLALVAAWLLLRPLGLLAERMLTAATFQAPTPNAEAPPNSVETSCSASVSSTEATPRSDRKGSAHRLRSARLLGEMVRIEEAFLTLEDQVRRARKYLPAALLSPGPEELAGADDGDSAGEYEGEDSLLGDVPQGSVLGSGSGTNPSNSSASSPTSPSFSSTAGSPRGSSSAPWLSPEKTFAGAKGGLSVAPLRSDLGLTRRRGTILYLNIRRFHRKVLGVQAAEVLSQYGTVVDFIGSVAEGHRGMLDAFHGDRFVITFNAARACKGHALAAVSSAFEIVDAGRAIRFSAGVAGGPLSVGNLGSKSARRFHTIGDAFGRATLLERLCAVLDVPLLCTETIAADVEASFHTIVLDEIPLPPAPTESTEGVGVEQSEENAGAEDGVVCAKETDVGDREFAEGQAETTTPSHHMSPPLQPAAARPHHGRRLVSSETLREQGPEAHRQAGRGRLLALMDGASPHPSGISSSSRQSLVAGPQTAVAPSARLPACAARTAAAIAPACPLAPRMTASSGGAGEAPFADRGNATIFPPTPRSTDSSNNTGPAWLQNEAAVEGRYAAAARLLRAAMRAARLADWEHVGRCLEPVPALLSVVQASSSQQDIPSSPPHHNDVIRSPRNGGPVTTAAGTPPLGSPTGGAGPRRDRRSRSSAAPHVVFVGSGGGAEGLSDQPHRPPPAPAHRDRQHNASARAGEGCGLGVDETDCDPNRLCTVSTTGSSDGEDLRDVLCGGGKCGKRRGEAGHRRPSHSSGPLASPDDDDEADEGGTCGEGEGDTPAGPDPLHDGCGDAGEIDCDPMSGGGGYIHAAPSAPVMVAHPLLPPPARPPRRTGHGTGGDGGGLLAVCGVASPLELPHEPSPTAALPPIAALFDVFGPSHNTPQPLAAPRAALRAAAGHLSSGPPRRLSNPPPLQHSHQTSASPMPPSGQRLRQGSSDVSGSGASGRSSNSFSASELLSASANMPEFPSVLRCPSIFAARGGGVVTTVLVAEGLERGGAITAGMPDAFEPNSSADGESGSSDNNTSLPFSATGCSVVLGPGPAQDTTTIVVGGGHAGPSPLTSTSSMGRFAVDVPSGKWLRSAIRGRGAGTGHVGKAAGGAAAADGTVTIVVPTPANARWPGGLAASTGSHANARRSPRQGRQGISWGTAGDGGSTRGTANNEAEAMGGSGSDPVDAQRALEDGRFDSWARAALQSLHERLLAARQRHSTTGIATAAATATAAMSSSTPAATSAPTTTTIDADPVVATAVVGSIGLQKNASLGAVPPLPAADTSAPTVVTTAALAPAPIAAVRCGGGGSATSSSLSLLGWDTSAFVLVLTASCTGDAAEDPGKVECRK